MYKITTHIARPPGTTRREAHTVFAFSYKQRVSVSSRSWPRDSILTYFFLIIFLIILFLFHYTYSRVVTYVYRRGLRVRNRSRSSYVSLVHFHSPPFLHLPFTYVSRVSYRLTTRVIPITSRPPEIFNKALDPSRVD